MNFPACQELPEAGQAVYIWHGDGMLVVLVSGSGRWHSRAGAPSRDGDGTGRTSCGGTGAEDA
jgi:hypothetical protein